MADFSGGTVAKIKMKSCSSVRSTRNVAVTAIIVVGNTALAAQDAAATYKAKCSACHGADGKGDTAMGKKMGLRDLASPEVQKMSDDELTAIIADGKDKMPSYKKSLKPDQIKGTRGVHPFVGQEIRSQCRRERPRSCFCARDDSARAGRSPPH